MPAARCHNYAGEGIPRAKDRPVSFQGADTHKVWVVFPADDWAEVSFPPQGLVDGKRNSCAPGDHLQQRLPGKALVQRSARPQAKRP